MAKENHELKKKIVNYLNAIRERQYAFSFRILCNRLREENLPVARGYKELIPKYEKMSIDNPSLEDYSKTIFSIYKDSIFYSKRAVSFYEFPNEYAKKIPAAIKSLVDENSMFSEKFPLPLPISKLRKVGHNGKFVWLRSNDKGVLKAIACSKRSFRERNPIEVDDLDSAAREALSGYDEVIGVKHGLIQAFDYVEFDPSTSVLSIHLDICCPLSQDDLRQIRVYYITRILEACDVSEEVKKSFEYPRNLFQYVQKFYDDVDGVVRKLGHATSTDSVKEERMRGRRKDLRQEPFHRKGLEEIKTTDSYAIQKSWATDFSNSPTIELPGNFADAGDPGAAIYHAVLEQCANSSEYSMLINKLTA